jgi:FkbM family methyltransferase
MPTFFWKLKSRLETFANSSSLFDNLLRKVLDGLANKEVFFVEIGANDGINGDPLYPYIIKHNWPGVYVEPQKAVFAQLVENFKGRKNLHFENIAITDKYETVTLYVPNDAYYSSIASLKKDVGMLGQFELEAQLVEAKPFDYLIDKYDLTSKKCLFLLIDVEGQEKQILFSIDFSRFSPTYVLFEHRLMDYDTHRAVNIFLTEKGYKIYVEKYDTLACKFH